MIRDQEFYVYKTLTFFAMKYFHLLLYCIVLKSKTKRLGTVDIPNILTLYPTRPVSFCYLLTCPSVSIS